MDRFVYDLQFKYSTRGLDMIQAVYAFVMALGLSEVFVGSSDFIKATIYGSKNITDFTVVAPLLLLANVTLLGIRFFSVPRNLRGIMFVESFNNRTKPGLQGLGNHYISFNWLIIFLQGGMYFLLCSEFKFIIFSLTSNAQPDASIFTGYFLGHAFLLIVNGLWISLLAQHEKRLSEKQNIPERRHNGGLFWSRNNLAFSLLALGPLSLLGPCRSEPFKCIMQFGVAPHGSESVIATSSLMVSGLFDAASRALSWVGIDYTHTLTYWILGCYLLNSILDLLKTGDYYLLLEEAEWAGKIEPVAAESGGGGTRQAAQITGTHYLILEDAAWVVDINKSKGQDTADPAPGAS